jgi:hypothetical protein
MSMRLRNALLSRAMSMHRPACRKASGDSRSASQLDLLDREACRVLESEADGVPRKREGFEDLHRLALAHFYGDADVRKHLEQAERDHMVGMVHIPKTSDQPVRCGFGSYPADEGTKHLRRPTCEPD